MAIHGLMKYTPFYRELADVLVGVDRLKRSLSRLLWALRLTERLTREYSMKAAKCFSAEEARYIRREYYGRLASVLREVDEEFKLLNEAGGLLSKLPDIDPEKPTIVVAAPPNVGKSTLVRRVSTAEPEIASYPFTTKNLILGHIEVRKGVIVQIMDTPGLLDRPLSERNRIELQAITALKHVASVIIFMIDPTHHAGYPLKYQLRVLKEITDSFSDVPIVVAINKVDIAKPEDIEKAREEIAKMGLEFPLFEISAARGDGVDKLMKEVLRLILGST